MSLLAIQCNDCGGSIAFPEDKPLPECPFCGSTKQIPQPLDRQVHPPSEWVPFEIIQTEADEAFRTFAQSSFWYPKDIRNATLDLQMILLPAWLWSGEVETHYNGLTNAMTPSGYRPTSGQDTIRYSQVWVPSSKALTLTELNDLAPFPSDQSQSLQDTPPLPFELGDLTERVALKHAKNVMSNSHHSHISSQTGLRQLQTSSVHHNMEGRPGLVPIYIGVYRRKDNYYRILINGSTGKLIGEAPLDWSKITLIVVILVGAVLILINL